MTQESDHDILIGIRSDLANLSTTVKEFITEQKTCNANIESRVRKVEIEGSKPVEEARKLLSDLCADVEDLKAFKDNCEGQNQGVMKVAAIVSGVVATAGTIVTIVLTFVFHI